MSPAISRETARTPNWQLQRTGITQGAGDVSRRASGEIAISFQHRSRPIVVAEEFTRAERAANARYFTRVDRESHPGAWSVLQLPQGSRCNSWRLGTDAPLQPRKRRSGHDAGVYRELQTPAARRRTWRQQIWRT